MKVQWCASCHWEDRVADPLSSLFGAFGADLFGGTAKREHCPKCGSSLVYVVEKEAS